MYVQEHKILQIFNERPKETYKQKSITLVTITTTTTKTIKNNYFRTKHTITCIVKIFENKFYENISTHICIKIARADNHKTTSTNE